MSIGKKLGVWWSLDRCRASRPSVDPVWLIALVVWAWGNVLIVCFRCVPCAIPDNCGPGGPTHLLPGDRPGTVLSYQRHHRLGLLSALQRSVSITMTSQDRHCVSDHWQRECMFKITTINKKYLCYHQPVEADIKGNIGGPYYWPFVRKIDRWLVDPSKRGSDAESISMSWRHHGHSRACQPPIIAGITFLVPGLLVKSPQLPVWSGNHR